MMRARWVWLGWSSLAVSITFMACGSDGEADPPGGTSPDASIAKADGATDATTSPDARANDAATDAAPEDAAIDAEGDADAGMPPSLSCKALHTASPALPSGIYMIDPDGTGPVSAAPTYCDMVFDGGGWTLILSVIAGHAINDPGDAGSDASPDAAFYLRPPAPSALGMFKGEFVQPLAQGASQVHVRSPFEPDAGADGGPAYVTSVVLADGGGTMPIVNLRNLALLNANGDGTFADWTGPNANASRLAYDNVNGNCSSVDVQTYPHLYWACNNTSGLHLGSGTARWIYGSDNAPNEAMEVYVR